LTIKNIIAIDSNHASQLYYFKRNDAFDSQRHEKELYSQIKGKMKHLRKKNKLTQSDIAKKLNVTVQHYQQVESGTTPPNLKNSLKTVRHL
jgi:DNA-binding XRE family transcriptional regulator